MDENMKRSQDYQLPPHRRVKPPETGQNNHPHHQPPPPQKCPRCDSSNTKFCYYNNYSLSQPRYFCKGCRRYWTHGGTLRNVPIGGCCRKNKRPKISAAASSSTQPPLPANPGMVSGQGLRPGMDPAMGPTNSSFYTHGGTLLSSLAALQSLPAGLNQSPPAGLTTVVGGRFGANMALLQGMNLSSLRPPQQPPHHQFQNDFLPPQQSMMSNWTTQGFVNRGGAAPSAGGFWGGDQVGSSFNPNHQWSSDHSNNNHQGFDPSQ